jgi:hypothetical protein
MNSKTKKSRRAFLNKLAMTAGATAGIAAIPTAVMATNPFLDSTAMADADEWFKKVKGTHRVVYDAPAPHDSFPFIWNWAFMLTNNQTGTKDEDMTAMVVLRHHAIPFAFKDAIWKKYPFGETFGVTDLRTGSKATRNTIWDAKDGDYSMPGIDGIKAQQARGAMYCVCELAISVYSGAMAGQMGLDPEVVKKEWMDNLHLGIQPVPSGVWALGRAQEHDCKYIYAGG